MEKITRFCLMHFPFNSQEQTEERYAEAKAALERSVRNMMVPADSQGLIVSYAAYNQRERQYLSSCIYRGNVFLGMYDWEDGRISFQDRAACLAEPGMEECFRKLEYRTNNEVGRILRGNAPNPYLAGIRNAWEERIPLLDQVLAYDRKVESMPEFERNLLRRSLAYDRAVDLMVSASQQPVHQGREHAVPYEMER